MNRRANSSVRHSSSERRPTSVGDLINHLALTETSKENFLLLFMVKVFLDLPVRKCRRYLIELWIRFRTRNEEETELETIPEAHDAPIHVVDSKSRLRIPASTNGYRRRDDRAKDLHFSDWWILGALSRYFVGKRFYCTPFVRPPVGKERYHFVMLCIYDDHPDNIKKIKDDMKGYTELHPPQLMFVQWKCGDIIIKFFDGPNENEKKLDEKSLRIRNLYILDTKISFEAKPLKLGASQKLLKLTLDQKESFSTPTVLKFTLPYDDIGTTRTTAATAEMFSHMHAGSQEAGMSMHLQTDLESDGILDKLSKHVPPRTYATLCRHLGIVYDEGQAILTRFNMDYQRATRHCLAQWKTRNGFNEAQIKTILQKAEVGDLVKYIKLSCEASNWYNMNSVARIQVNL